MKKILFTSAIIACTFVLHAQHVELGIKGGLNVSNVDIPNTSNIDPRLSPFAGGLVHIHLSKEFAIQPEIVFSSQGFKTGNDEVYRLNYLNFPALAMYMFNSGFRLQTGPQVGVLLSADYKKGSNTKVDIKNGYKDIDVSWVFGGGYIMPSGFGFDARFNLGLAKLNDNTSAKAANRVFQVGVFYQFKPLKHK